MNNLVLGSERFLGKRLCKFLEGKNQSVVSIDIKNSTSQDLRKMQLSLDNIDRVYFLAWDVGGSKYLYNSSTRLTQMEWNSQLMNNVFPQLKETPFVFISSPEKFKEDFSLFLENLNLYSPREFILETLSPESCIDRWHKVLCRM